MVEIKELHAKKLKNAERDAVKERIRKLEKENYDKIYLFWNGGDFYRTVMHSMLIYYFDVARVLKRSAEIITDNDYGKVCFPDGMISFRGVDHITERLKKVDILQSRTISKDGMIVTFKLNRTYLATEIEEMASSLREERRQIGLDLRPVVSHPEIYASLRHLEKRASDLIGKIKEYKRELVGYNFAKLSHEMTTTYLMMEQNMISTEEGWKKIFDNLMMMKIELIAGVELKYWEEMESARVAREIVETQNMVRKILMNKHLMSDYNQDRIQKEKVAALKDMLENKE